MITNILIKVCQALFKKQKELVHTVSYKTYYYYDDNFYAVYLIVGVVTGNTKILWH